jgi:hypothetical protein
MGPLHIDCLVVLSEKKLIEIIAKKRLKFANSTQFTDCFPRNNRRRLYLVYCAIAISGSDSGGELERCHLPLVVLCVSLYVFSFF